jgi:hypothetical protein
MPASAVQQRPLVFGPDVTPADRQRLHRQLDEVRHLMADGEWRTLADIEWALAHKHSQASLSARLRDLRKTGWTVDRRRVKPGSGTFEYRAVRP